MSNTGVQEGSGSRPAAAANPARHASSLAELQQIHRELSPGNPKAGELRTMPMTRSMVRLKFDATDPKSISDRGERLFAELERLDHLRGRTKEDFVHRMAEHIERLNTLQPFARNNESATEVHLTRLAAQAGYTLETSSMRSQAWTVAVHLASTTDNLADLRSVLRKSVTSTRALAFAEGLKRSDREGATRQHPELSQAYGTIDYAKAILSHDGSSTEKSMRRDMRAVVRGLKIRLNDGEIPQTPSRDVVMQLMQEARGRAL